MISPLLLYFAIFGGILASLLLRSSRVARGALVVTGLCGLVYGYQFHGLYSVILPALVTIIALVQSLGAIMADRSAVLSEDEAALHAGPLAGLGRGDARRFLDQGMWMHGRAGDTLTREGEQVGHLYWLADGEAEVISHGAVVGRCGAGQLIGEATVLSPDVATATVRLTRHSRFWAAPAKALTAYLSANPHTRHALEHGFNLSLKDKLDTMNRARP